MLFVAEGVDYTCPTHTIAGIFELYEQMLPWTRLYTSQKIRTTPESEVLLQIVR